MLTSTLSGTDELVALSQLIVREQTHPTAAFDFLFCGALEPSHKAGTALIAAYVGGDRDDVDFVVHYHLIMGSVLALRVARETLLRRTGWTDIGESERAHIAVLLTDHVSFTLRGMRARHLREKSK